jgi:transcriptional regulator
MNRRQQDEKALAILKLRQKGVLTKVIGKMMGCNQQAVSRICQNVATADREYPDTLAYAGSYRNAYPWVRTNKGV